MMVLGRRTHSQSFFPVPLGCLPRHTGLTQYPREIICSRIKSGLCEERSTVVISYSRDHQEPLRGL